MKMLRDSQMLLWWVMLTDDEKDVVLDAIRFILTSHRYKTMVETTIITADQLTDYGRNDPTA